MAWISRVAESFCAPFCVLSTAWARDQPRIVAASPFSPLPPPAPFFFPFTGSDSCNLSAFLPRSLHTPSASMVTFLLLMATAVGTQATSCCRRRPRR